MITFTEGADTVAGLLPALSYLILRKEKFWLNFLTYWYDSIVNSLSWKWVSYHEGVFKQKIQSYLNGMGRERFRHWVCGGRGWEISLREPPSAAGHSFDQVKWLKAGSGKWELHSLPSVTQLVHERVGFEVLSGSFLCLCFPTFIHATK